MSRTRGVPPTTETIKVVTRFALAWSIAGLLVQTVFAAVIAPSLGATLDFALPGRGPTLAVPVDTTAVSITGLVVTVIAAAVSLVAIVTVSGASRGAYAAAVVVSIVVPGFVALVTANGLATLTTGGESTTGTAFLAIAAGVVGFGLGGLSVAQAPKLAAARGA